MCTRNPGGANLTIGDVITSERGAAVLLRLHVRWSGALSAASKGKEGKGKPILHDAIVHVLGDKTLKDTEGKPLDWEKPASTWETSHEVALVDAMVHFTGVLGGPKQVASVSNARFWPFVAAKGSLVLKKIKNEATATPGKDASTKTKDPKQDEKLVPVLVGKDTGWVPKVADPTPYGPKEERGFFKPYG